ncbi:collagen-binding domain-containing protein [Niveibacterium terrae]|uniref:collagen-binding domain-containing protein n=1 Tax=Niveibacterium terrae TaxID=3373598 RepID=UPI003A95906C
MPRFSRKSLLCLLALIAAPVWAMPLNALEILQQFNLVVLGDATSSSHVHGRSYIEGDALGKGRAEFGEDAKLAASAYAGTTVLGSLSNFTVNNGGLTVAGNAAHGIVNSGTSRVRGDVEDVIFNGSAEVDGTARDAIFNGGRIAASAGPQSFPASTLKGTDFRDVLSRESDAIRDLAANSKASRQGSRLAFKATPDANGVAVFTLDSLAGISEFSFDIGSDTRSVLINCGIASADLAINFLGGSAQSLGGKLLWNFYDATRLSFSAQWGGAILATDAFVTNSADIEGTLIANKASINGEIHQNAFTGELPPGNRTPEPASLALFGVGLLGLIAVRRRA